MNYINTTSLLKKAQDLGVAVAAFNIHNLETVQAVVMGASEENSPVIIQTTPGTLRHAGISYISSIVKTAATIYDIPIVLHLDHCSSFETTVQCIKNGYTSVMIDGSKLPYDENVALVKKVVEIAHYAGVSVEAELGKIGGTEDDSHLDESEALFTVPEEAKAFVEATGVDSLAIAIGTSHGAYKGEPKLDFERLTKIKNLVDVPLVLHGASGISDENIQEAVKRGICKVNIATELKISMANAIKECFKNNMRENDPRNYMGNAKKAVKEVVKSKIKLCGTSNLANKLGELK